MFPLLHKVMMMHVNANKLTGMALIFKKTKQKTPTQQKLRVQVRNSLPYRDQQMLFATVCAREYRDSATVSSSTLSVNRCGA